VEAVTNLLSLWVGCMPIWFVGCIFGFIAGRRSRGKF
jgi:hypothetical protein